MGRWPVAIADGGRTRPRRRFSTVVVSRHEAVDNLAIPHVREIRHLQHSRIIALFDKAAEALERVCSLSTQTVDESLRQEAVQVYQQHQVFLPQVIAILQSTMLKDLRIHSPNKQ